MKKDGFRCGGGAYIFGYRTGRGKVRFQIGVKAGEPASYAYLYRGVWQSG